MYLQRSLAQTKLSVLHLAFLMKRGFLFSQPKSAISAEQPASDGGAVQPASDGSAAQPPITCRSIADVDSWLKANTVALGWSVEAKRIKDVVEVLSARPKPRKEDVQKVFNTWGVKQRSQKKQRPLSERIQELSTKVIEATIKLQADLPSMVSSAEQPGASSATPPAPQPRSFDILLASQRCNDLAENYFHPKPPPEKNYRLELPKEAFRFLQDCRKYKKDNFLGAEEDKQIDQIIKQLAIESQPHFSSDLCREIYKHSKVAQILGPFGRLDSAGHREYNDHEHVRATAFDTTIEDLTSFLRRRDALRAEEYPSMALLETLGVKVIRKSRQQIFKEKQLEILQDMPDTKVLPLLPDYAEHEWLYRFHADIRDTAAGIPIEGPKALTLFCQELRNRRKEDGEESSEEDPEALLIYEFREECRRKWTEQGKTEEECKRMWPQALADWRAENEIAADFDAMQI